MTASIFENFSWAIAAVPAGAIIRALEIENAILMADLVHGQTMPIEEVKSIVSFCEFIQGLEQGLIEDTFTLSLPPHHLLFYRETVDRLVTAKVIPADARRRLEVKFNEAIPELMALRD